jgi:hypothetical protein
MSRVGKKPRKATIFGFTSVVQIAKWLLHNFRLEAVFCLGVWQGFYRSRWRNTWKIPAKGPLSLFYAASLLRLKLRQRMKPSQTAPAKCIPRDDTGPSDSLPLACNLSQGHSLSSLDSMRFVTQGIEANPTTTNDGSAKSTGSVRQKKSL